MTTDPFGADTLGVMDQETEALLEESARGRARAEQLLRESELRMAVLEAKVQLAQLRWEVAMRQLRAAGRVKLGPRARGG